MLRVRKVEAFDNASNNLGRWALDGVALIPPGRYLRQATRRFLMFLTRPGLQFAKFAAQQSIIGPTGFANSIIRESQ